MSSVINKSKNKFAPKAKVRTRTAASGTPAPTETSQSLSTTPARSEPQNSPASPPPDSFDRSPLTSASVPSPRAPDHEPYEDRDASIPALGGVGESRDQGPPALEGEVAPAETRPSRLTPSQFPTEEIVHGLFSDRSSVVISIPGLGASTTPHGRNAEQNGEPRQTETVEGPARSSNGAKTTRTRKVPATKGPQKTIAKTAIEALSAEPPAEGIRKSARAKKGTVQDEMVEGGPVNDGQTVDDDAEDEDEYREDSQPRQSDENALTKKRKRVPRKPKEPGERRTRRRAETPPDAEERKIQEDVVKMKDLCKDLKTGKKSKKYKELESTDWNEVVRRQRAHKAELKARRASGQPVDETTEQRLDRLWQTSGAARSMAAPQMRIVDGQIVLDEESLRVDRHQRDALEEGNMEVVEENQHSRLVNSGTWSKHEKGDRWESAATERFYETLSMFGTDFEMISKLFPGRTRRQIKNKYNCEERKNPKRITLALKHRVAVDLDEYSEAAGQAFAEPQDLEDELQRLREQYETEGELQKAQAVEVERERQEQANQAMHDAENGVVPEQPGKKKKKGRNKDASRAGEVVLSMSIAEYERERLRQLAEEDE